MPSLEDARVLLCCMLKQNLMKKFSIKISRPFYRWVNKYCKYPVGFPEAHLNPSNQDIHSYFGVALTDVLAPEQLFHLVLPVQEGGKLTFPLCGSCVKEEQQKPWLERSNMCGHNAQERALRSTWCMPELQKAVEKGYRILKIRELWHFTPEN